VKEQYEADCYGQGGVKIVGPIMRSRWVVDENIPIFTQDRDYIGRLL
jgi:hypothetical protein